MAARWGYDAGSEEDPPMDRHARRLRKTAALVACLVALGACKGKAEDDSTPDDTNPGTDDSTPTSGDACLAPGSSRCDNPASIIRGYVSMDPTIDESNWSGNLWVFLNHYRFGEGELGGDNKQAVVYKGVDLAKGPVPFEIDMCDGSFGAQWSEETCEYSLLLVLDKDGDMTPERMLPDENEPAHMELIELSCQADSLCFDQLELDCGRGAPCAQFDSLKLEACECAETSCESEYPNCN
jgi:hypothetical protein